MLVALIKGGNLEDRVLAAGALGFSKDRSVLPYLLDTLKPQTPPDIRKNALMSIGILGSSETPAAPILASMQDRNAEVRCTACYAAGRIVRAGDDRGMTAPLLKAIDDDDWQVRNNAVVALMNVGAREAAVPLVQKLQDASVMVRMNSALALGVLKDPATYDALVDALQSEESAVVHAAAESLEKISGQKFGRSYPLWKDWLETQKMKDAEAQSKNPAAPQAPPDAPATPK